MAALRDTNILSADIQNAYLNTPVVRDKLYTIAGKEFEAGSHRVGFLVVEEQQEIIWDILASNLQEMGYESTKADPDLWMMPDSTKADGTEVILPLRDLLPQQQCGRDYGETSELHG
jgi:hypothetical protein